MTFFYCSEDVWIKFVSPTLCLHSSVWWAFIRRGWKEAASVHPRCLAHPCYYGLLPSRGKHSSGQLAHRSVQVCGCLHANLPFTLAVGVLFVFVFKIPQQHVLWGQVHLQPSVEIPEIPADHDVPRPAHPPSPSHHPESPLHPLQQDVPKMCQEETRRRVGWEGPGAQ